MNETQEMFEKEMLESGRGAGVDMARNNTGGYIDPRASNMFVEYALWLALSTKASRAKG